MPSARSPKVKEVVAHIDGASRGNPGPAAYGVVIKTARGTPIAAFSKILGRTTNNVAEYQALLAALEHVLEDGHARLRVLSDSELLVRQIEGSYKVKSPDLKPLYQRARQMIGKLDSFAIQYVPREQNREADRLANQALDASEGKSINHRDTEAQREQNVEKEVPRESASFPEATNRITGAIVDAAYAVHSKLGPGLLESVYEVCLAHELKKRGLRVERQVSLPVHYDGMDLDAGLRLDLIVEKCVIVELKAVEAILPVHTAQMLTYLKLTGHRVGLLINFNVPLIRDGIKRIVL